MLSRKYNASSRAGSSVSRTPLLGLPMEGSKNSRGVFNAIGMILNLCLQVTRYQSSIASMTYAEYDSFRNDQASGQISGSGIPVSVPA